MLIGGSSDYGTAVRVADGVAKSGANIYIVRSAHCYDVIEVPTVLDLVNRLEVLKQEKRAPEAVWTSGKRTK